MIFLAILFILSVLLFGWISYLLFSWALEPILKDKEGDRLLSSFSQTDNKMFPPFCDEDPTIIGENGERSEGESEFDETEEVRLEENINDKDMEISISSVSQDDKLISSKEPKDEMVGKKKDLNVEDLLKWIIIYRRNKPPRG